MSTSSPSGSSVPAARDNRLTVVLLLVIAVLLAVIAWLVGTRSTGEPTASPSTTATTAASGEPATQETAAATTTDAQVLELMHAEVKRDANDGQATGKVDAPVVMVLYSDFSCPYCTLFAQQVQPEIADLVKDGTLRIEWRDLAQISESSPLAAQAGLAAAEQGRFWEFHDVVYGAADPNDHPTYTEDLLRQYAQQAGVPDLERFSATMTDSATVTAVADAKKHAYNLGISGTPFMIVNDAVIGGFKDAAYVRATVLDQAARAKG